MLCHTVTRFFGMGAVGWALICLATAWETADTDMLAKRIIAGAVFADTVLDDTDKNDQKRFFVGPATFFRSGAVIRLRRLETSMENADEEKLDPRVQKLSISLDSSLSLTPTDSFLWFALFWLKNNQAGYSKNNLKYLEFSYRLGHWEQWISEKRNRPAMTVFSQLPAMTQASIISEFSGLVDATLFEDTATTLVGAGWSIRDQLLAGLAKLDVSLKEAFIDNLGRKGYRINIPGTPERDERPWR